MSKFKVGDKVRILDGSNIDDYTGKWSSSFGCSDGMEKYIGEVHSVIDVDNSWSDDRVSYRLEDTGYIWDERGLELVHSTDNGQKIVITCDGKTTTAVLYEGKKRIKDAKAFCSPDDIFDFNYGASLALDRLTGFVRGQVDSTLEVEENSDWDKFIAGEIAFEMTSDKYEAFLKEVEKRFPKLRWSSHDKPSKWAPRHESKCYFVVTDNIISYGNNSPIKSVQWTDKSCLNWNKFAHGELEVKVSKERFDGFMNLCEAKNFAWSFGKSATTFNPWEEYKKLNGFVKAVVDAVGEVPGEHVYVSFASDEDVLKWSVKHDEDCDTYEFV